MTHIGLIGLNGLGLSLAQGLKQNNKSIIVYDRNEESVYLAAEAGFDPAFSIKELVEKIKSPRVIWIVCNNPDQDNIILEIQVFLSEGDTIVDVKGSTMGIDARKPLSTRGSVNTQGSINSRESTIAEELNHKNTIANYKNLKELGINYLDAGVSYTGSEEKLFSIMVGGDKKVYDRVEKMFSGLSRKELYIYVGEAGSGHLAQSVLNKIKIGFNKKFNEARELLKKSDYEFDIEEVLGFYRKELKNLINLIN